MTSVVNGLANTSVPQFVNVVDSLSSANLQGADGALNLQPILDTQQAMTAANTSLQQQVTTYNNLPGAHISMISQAYDSGKKQLDTLGTTINQLAATFNMLPQMLNGNQTYAIIAQTPSELRSSGGLIGSVGELTINNGKIDVGNFHSNGDYLRITHDAAPHTQDEQHYFRDKGPLNMSFDIRDIAVFPNTADTAKAMQAVWQKTPWGANTPLSGVIMADPAFVQNLIGLTGDVHLSNGAVLTGKNTAEYLLNTVYIEYPNDGSMTDMVFEKAATQAISHMFSDMNVNKLMKVGKSLGQMAQERHFTMYSFNENVEKDIQNAGFTATTPDSSTQPEIGVYMNEQSPSKMGWYLKRNVTITPETCNGNGSRKYRVQYHMTNTATDAEIAQLPWCITGSIKTQPGWMYEKMLFFAPKGGSISDFNASGSGSAENIAQVPMNGEKPYGALAKLLPGQTLTFSYTVTVAPDATAELGVDQTPLNEPGSNVTYEKGSCK
ncbi:DUF4012 domain-containing protein [Bifidobacterium magnum]|uniref:Chemotaxis protein n=1 Tax=Bifidobacterium magnum TaxID=1692 RepID=A0A087BBC9_9BIFI|nr:DUF4012 domain-containing protein [Bifidobacterium magnum]KFI68329.1 hypothetical protein BMAGN_0290 [Bifidobacterium magnum]